MVKKKTVFISYNRRDFPFVSEMRTFLENNECEVWLDLRDIQGGMTWWDETQSAILGSDIFLVVLSKYSAMSEYVGKEVIIALSHGRQVVPVLLQEADGFPPGLERIQWIDARRHFRRAMQQLLGVLSTTNPSISSEGGRRDRQMKIQNLVAISGPTGWFRSPMPATMYAVGFAVGTAAGVKALLAIMIYLYFGSDYLGAVKQAYSTQTDIMIIAPELAKLAGLAFLFMLMAGTLLWVARKLGHRELAFRETLLSIATCLIAFLILLVYESGWFFRWFVGGDVFMFSFIALGPVAEAVALVILTTQRSARRYMPSVGYYPIYEKIGWLNRNQ